MFSFLFDLVNYPTDGVVVATIVQVLGPTTHTVGDGQVQLFVGLFQIIFPGQTQCPR